MTVTLSQIRTFVNAHSAEAAAWYTYRNNLEDAQRCQVSRDAWQSLQDASGPIVDAMVGSRFILSANHAQRRASSARLREFATRCNMRTARNKGVPETMIAAVFHVANTNNEQEARRLNDKRIATRNY